MADKGSQGQADKAAAESKTAQVGADSALTGQNDGQVTGADANNSEGMPQDAAAGNDPQNPYPNYDFMTLEALQSLADERGVEVNRDVLKAHLVTELRAADSGTVSPAVRKGAR